MTISEFFNALLAVAGAMSPYLLLGFLIAGVLHVFVPKTFYARYLSSDNKLSVLWAAFLGVPLPLCSCGVIPTAVGLKNEGASKGAVASFLIATPQTGIDSILATFSLMGLGFAVVRPVAALVTGVCGGLLVNRLAGGGTTVATTDCTCTVERGNRLWRVLKYAYFDMIQDIGLRLLVGLIVAALINVAVPDDFFTSFNSDSAVFSSPSGFFLYFGKQPLLQMLVILVVAVPMYICSTGSIPVAAALMMKGLSPGAALVMLMAGPAVNIASILVVRKSMGARFTWIYLLTIVGFSILFGLLINALDGLIPFTTQLSTTTNGACCHTEAARLSFFQIICSAMLTFSIIFALTMKLFSKFKKQETAAGTVVYTVEGMHCNHCKAAVEKSVGKLKGVDHCEATPAANTLVVTGTAPEADVRMAVEQAGFGFKGVKE